MSFFAETLKQQNKEQRDESYRYFVTVRTDYAKTYGSESGQRVLKKMILDSGMFLKNHREKNQLFEAEGSRKTILDVLFHAPMVVGQALYSLCEDSQKELDLEHARRVRELDEP